MTQHARPRRHCRWCVRRLHEPGNRLAYPSMSGVYAPLRFWLCDDCVNLIEALFDLLPAEVMQRLIESPRLALALKAG